MSNLFAPSSFASYYGSTGGSVIITGSPYYYVTGISITLDSNSFASAATPCVLALTDSSAGIIWGGLSYLPASSVAASGAQMLPTLYTPPGFFYKSPVSGSSLSLVINAFGHTTSLGYFLNIQYGLTSL